MKQSYSEPIGLLLSSIYVNGEYVDGQRALHTPTTCSTAVNCEKLNFHTNRVEMASYEYQSVH